MTDIYLHSCNVQDVALFNQFVARKLLFEQGIVPPQQIVSQHRNEMLRSYIKSIADNERATTAGGKRRYTRGACPLFQSERLKPLPGQAR